MGAVTFRWCGIQCSDIQVLSMADVFCHCVACRAVKLHGDVSQHDTPRFIAAGFGAQDIGLQSNFRGPSGQQGPYGSSGKPSVCYALLVCFAACFVSSPRGDSCSTALAVALHTCDTHFFLFRVLTALAIYSVHDAPKFLCLELPNVCIL